MGSIQTQIPLLCSNTPGDQLHHQRYIKELKCVRKTLSQDLGTKNRIYLDQFRGKLTVEECFYVFAQLLRFSFKKFMEDGQVFICLEICEINSWGQIQVQWDLFKSLIRNNQLALCVNLSNITTKIMQLVKELSIQQLWEQVLEKSQLLGKLTKISYKQHNKPQIQLFRQLMQDVSHFKASNNFRNSLLSAIPRLRQNEREQSIFLGNLKTAKSVHDIYSGFKKKNSILSFHPDKTSRQDCSKMGKSTRFQSTLDRGRGHKVSKTEGDAFFNLNFEQDNYLIREKKMAKPQRMKRNLYISCQYSLNILCSKPKQQSQSKPRVRFRESKENTFQTKVTEPKLQRMKTVQNLTQQRRFKHQRVNAKSVLQQLARSVEVLDNPSSKSLIF